MHLRSRIAVLIAVGLLTAIGRISAQASVSGWPDVRINLFGVDKTGASLNDLSKAQVFVYEDRHPVNVISLERNTSPLSICVLIDASSSSSSQMKIIMAGAARLLLNIAAEDEVCVAHFNVRLFIDQGLTRNRQADLQALQGLNSSGGTALYDSLGQMARYMRTNAKQEGRALVLLSDGGNNYSSSWDLARLRKELQASGAPAVHFIKLQDKAAWTPSVRSTSTQDDADLLQMATGIHCMPFSISEIELCTDRLSAALMNQFSLTFVTADQVKNGRIRRIDVQLNKVEQKAHAEVRAPEGYYAPSQ